VADIREIGSGALQPLLPRSTTSKYIKPTLSMCSTDTQMHRAHARRLEEAGDVSAQHRTRARTDQSVFAMRFLEWHVCVWGLLACVTDPQTQLWFQLAFLACTACQIVFEGASWRFFPVYSFAFLLAASIISLDSFWTRLVLPAVLTRCPLSDHCLLQQSHRQSIIPARLGACSALARSYSSSRKRPI
jgi:hypothetical protein